MAQNDALYGEVNTRLTHLGVSAEVRDAVMALVRARHSHDAVARERTPAEYRVLVAQTFYKSILRATQALGTGSVSTLVMLFDLFVAFEQKRPISVSSLCIASGAAPTTALRQIGLLEAKGFVAREGDTKDRRRSWVTPTPAAIALVRALTDDWMALLRP